jgi:hypothetical protein
MGGVCSAQEDRRIAYRVLVEGTERKRLLGRPTRRWDNNIKTDLQDVKWESMDWIDLAKYRDRSSGLVTAIMKFGFHKMRGIS